MMNGEEVFSIHHSVLHWAHQCSTGSYKCLFIWWFVCVIWKQNTILIRNNIVLNVKFHFAGELRGFAHCVCVFWFVCRVLRIWGMLSENVCKQSRKTLNHFGTVTHYPNQTNWFPSGQETSCDLLLPSRGQTGYQTGDIYI